MGRHFRSMQNTRNEKQHLLLRANDSVEMRLNMSISSHPFKGQRAHFQGTFYRCSFDSFLFNSQLEAQIFIIWFPRKSILFSEETIQYLWDLQNSVLCNVLISLMLTAEGNKSGKKDPSPQQPAGQLIVPSSILTALGLWSYCTFFHSVCNWEYFPL